MPFNSFDESRLNAFRDSGFNARSINIPFTARFWFALDLPRPGKIMQLLAGQFGPVSSWAAAATGSGRISFRMGSSTVDPFPQLFTSSLWNYFLFGYDGTQIFCQLNDGSRHFFAAPFGKCGPGLVLQISKPAVDLSGVQAYANPKIDEVAIWKNRVLTEAEAADDYENEAGFSTVTQDRLLAYWELQGTEGTKPATLVDSMNGYVLVRVDSYQQEMLDLFPGVQEDLAPVYAPGKIGTGLLGVDTSGFEALGYIFSTRFQTGDDAFTFGDD